MAVGGWVYNFPAGLIDPGETPEVSAARELKEEIERINQEIRRDYVEQFPGSKNYLFDYVPEELAKHLQISYRKNPVVFWK